MPAPWVAPLLRTNLATPDRSSALSLPRACLTCGPGYPPAIGGDFRIVACQPRTSACFWAEESLAEECIQV